MKFSNEYARILWQNQLSFDSNSSQLLVHLRITLHHQYPKRDNLSKVMLVSLFCPISFPPHLGLLCPLHEVYLHFLHSVSEWHGTNYEEWLEITNIALHCWILLAYVWDFRESLPGAWLFFKSCCEVIHRLRSWGS